MSATADEPVERRTRVDDRRAAWVCRATIALAIVGVFGTWRTAGAVSLSGLEGPHNGWLVIIFAVIALVGVGPLSHGSWLGIVTVLGCAGVMAFTAVENVVDDGDVIGGRSGWGVWLTIAASVLLGGTAVLAALRGLRPSAEALPGAGTVADG